MKTDLQPIFDRLLAGFGITREEVAALHSAINPPNDKPIIPPHMYAPRMTERDSFSDTELALMAWGNSPRANAYRELLQLRREINFYRAGNVVVGVANAIEYVESIAFHIDTNDYHGQHIHHFMSQALEWLKPIRELSNQKTDELLEAKGE